MWICLYSWFVSRILASSRFCLNKSRKIDNILINWINLKTWRHILHRGISYIIISWKSLNWFLQLIQSLIIAEALTFKLSIIHSSSLIIWKSKGISCLWLLWSFRWIIFCTDTSSVLFGYLQFIITLACVCCGLSCITFSLCPDWLLYLKHA